MAADQKITSPNSPIKVKSKPIQTSRRSRHGLEAGVVEVKKVEFQDSAGRKFIVGVRKKLPINDGLIEAKSGEAAFDALIKAGIYTKKKLVLSARFAAKKEKSPQKRRTAQI